MYCMLKNHWLKSDKVSLAKHTISVISVLQINVQSPELVSFPIDTKMSYPFTWSPVSEEWESKRRRVFELGSNQLKNQICSPFGVCAPEPSKIIYKFEICK